MADVEKRKIKLRRGQEADLPTLDEGEPALTLDTNKFFIGGTTGNIQLAGQKDLETLSSSVDSVKEDISTAQTDISGLKTDVTTTKEDVSKLQTDVSTVKTDLDTAEGNIGSLQTDMTAAKADVSTLKTDMTTAKSDISTLKSDVGNAKSDVSTLKSDMTTAKSNISSLQTDTGSLQTDVGGLKNLISSSNGAVDVGDAAMDATIKGKEKVSIAAPVLNVSSRETYHQGNFCNHAIFSSSEAVAPATLPKDTYTDLTAVLDTVDSAFPAVSASAAAYTVPREGVYSFNVTVKVTTAVTATAGYIRFGLKQSRGETVTDLDIQDVHYSNAFGTPLLSATFIYKCAAGDVITPVIKPLTEDITVGTGSKCSIYFLGDSIQA
ncbi:hypothetical protein BSP10_234 [Bacillus phage BSP10]|nr:hypothetical protein BSP10_234 [Bacillus phage BSP10]QRI44782.1 minor capsid protein [Bacillus phage BSTP3]